MHARTLFRFLLGALLGAVSARAVEINVMVPNGFSAAGLPRSVVGIARQGIATHPVKIALADREGRLRAEARPAVAVLTSAAWSPHDPARDGAGEFEVFLGTAKLLQGHALAGFVTVGNRYGALLPGTESALQRVVHMGLPVVRLARDGEVGRSQDDLFIAAGPLNANEAQRILSTCLLELGALPPAADPAKPTPSEVRALRAKLAQYQAAFDHAAAPRLAARHGVSEAEAVALAL
jgi:hypothetical protein